MQVLGCDLAGRSVGEAENIAVTKDDTVILGGKGVLGHSEAGGAGNKDDIQARTEQIEAIMEGTSSSYEKDKLKEREGTYIVDHKPFK